MAGRKRLTYVPMYKPMLVAPPFEVRSDQVEAYRLLGYKITPKFPDEHRCAICGESGDLLHVDDVEGWERMVIADLSTEDLICNSCVLSLTSPE